MAQRKDLDDTRFGIAELFGYQIDRITKKARDELLGYSLNKSTKDYPLCPFRLPNKKGDRRCNKKGGVCSLRLYKNRKDMAERVSGKEGSLTVTCPLRFHENRVVFNWAGKEILGITDAQNLALAGEVRFLENPYNNLEADDSEDVGHIDLILVDKQSVQAEFLKWCALEIQAVYFSGRAMESEFKAIIAGSSDALPFPAKNRRPDYRSSGPKRLMPQLQIKVPSLRRWGKKMAVVIDSHFFSWISTMEEVNDISNCDIVWFIADFEEEGEMAKICPGKIVYTTLERAIDGLTGGIPVSMATFENRIRAKVLGVIHAAK